MHQNINGRSTPATRCGRRALSASANLAFGLLGVALAACAAPASAAVVSFVGSQLDMRTGAAPNLAAGDDWRSTSVLKPLDLDANNVFGTAGYRMFGGAAKFQLPSFITAISNPGSTYPGNGTYIPMDDPAATPGATVADVATGTTNPGPGDIFSFTTAASGVPATFRVTLINDNLDATQFNSGSFRIRGTGGGATGDSGQINVTSNNRNPDAYIFDITNAQPGETYTVSAPTVQGGGTATLGIIAFDAPEPATLGLLAIASSGLLHRRRRAR